MTPQSLAAAAKLLYGDQWQRPLSRSLSIDNRLVRRWSAEDRPIPSWVESAIAGLLTKRKEAIEQAIEELAQDTDVTDIHAKCKTFD